MPRPIAHGKNLLPPGLVAVRVEVDGVEARFPIDIEDTPETVNARVAWVMAGRGWA